MTGCEQNRGTTWRLKLDIALCSDWDKEKASVPSAMLPYVSTAWK